MSFRLERLRKGELIAGVSAVLLIVFMFATTWYGASASPGRASVSINGWHGLTHVRWLVVLTIVVALALVFFQVTRRAPAIPAILGVIVTTLGVLTVLALIYRVVLNPPGNDLGQRAGAFLGLACSLGILYGGFASLRQEGIRDADGPPEIERVSLNRERAAGPS